MMMNIVGNAMEITEITIRDAYMTEPEKRVKVIDQVEMAVRNLFFFLL
jgi:hypothetical protein